MTIFRTWKKNVTLNGIRTWNLSFTILCSKLEVPGSNPTMGKKKIHVRKIANFSYCVLLCLVTGKAHLWTMKDKHCGELMNYFWCCFLLPSTNSWEKIGDFLNKLSICKVTNSQCLKILKKVAFNICERSELRLHFEWTKVHEKCQKMVHFGEFFKTVACGQTVLPDRSIFIEQKIEIRHFEWFSNKV